MTSYVRCMVVPVVSALVVGVGLLAPSHAVGEETGSIKGEISVSGARGVRSPENVVVYVEEVPGEHKAPADPVKVDQIKLVFIPHVLPIVKGTTVEFHNGDPLLHNVFWPKSKGYGAYNLGTWGKGGKRSYTFDQLGQVVLLCNVHPEMESHVVVLQNPFFAVVSEDGKYEITGVPPGEYTLKTWYTNPRRLRSKSAAVTVKAGEAAEQDFSLSRK
ncbi:MAG: hypothetical protein ACC628_08485 [Pirellulaceae bacterium]